MAFEAQVFPKPHPGTTGPVSPTFGLGGPQTLAFEAQIFPPPQPDIVPSSSSTFSEPPQRMFRLNMVRVHRGGDDVEDNKEVREIPPWEGTDFWEGDPWATVGGSTQI